MINVSCLPCGPAPSSESRGFSRFDLVFFFQVSRVCTAVFLFLVSWPPHSMYLVYCTVPPRVILVFFLFEKLPFRITLFLFFVFFRSSTILPFENYPFVSRYLIYLFIFLPARYCLKKNRLLSLLFLFSFQHDTV